MKKIVWMLLFYWAVLGAAKAQVLSGSLGTSWLKIAPSTRNAGMGDSALAVTDAYDAADINPAGLGLLGGTYFSLSQNFYAQGISAQHLIFTQATTNGDGFSLGVNYINFGNIATYNVIGNVLTANGSYSPVGLNLYAAYGLGLGDGLRVGITGHFIYDDIQQSFPDQTGALDAGFYFHQPNRPLSFSLVMTDLGWNIDEATLPLQVKAGGAYQLIFGSAVKPSHLVTLSGEVDTFLNDGNYAQVGLGAEYWYEQLLALRAGYQFSNIGDLTGLTGLSLGAGIRYLNWQLDYALITLGELGVANQISLSLKLGGDEITQTPTNTATATPVLVMTETSTPTAFPVAPSPTATPFYDPRANEVASPVPVLVENTPTATSAITMAGTSLIVHSDFKVTLPHDLDFEQLDKLVEFLLVNPDLKITIDGYADNRGSPAVNLGVSMARAGRVRNYLKRKGVPAQTILWTKGHASENPVGDNSTDEGRRQNRRVVIQWTPADQVSTLPGADLGTPVEETYIETPVVPPQVSIVTAKKWWKDPFDAETAYERLIKKIVPALVAQNQMLLLGGHRTLFFDELREQKIEHRKYLGMVSGYYTAVAKNLTQAGRAKEAEFYIHLALFYQAYNLDALELQPQIDKKAFGN